MKKNKTAQPIQQTQPVQLTPASAKLLKLALIKEQDNKCAATGLEFKKPVLDHEHRKGFLLSRSGQVRGMNATIICDASFCPKTKAGGWAIWLRSNLGLVRRSGAFKQQPGSVVESACWAIANGLYIADQKLIPKKLIYSNNPEAIRWTNQFVPGVFRLRYLKSASSAKSRVNYAHNWCDKEAKRMMRQMRSRILARKETCREACNMSASKNEGEKIKFKLVGSLIERVRVARETDCFVFLIHEWANGHKECYREMKETEDYAYFDTRVDAHSRLIDNLKRELKIAELALRMAEKLKEPGNE